jgi:hypothetical protein
MTLQYVPVSVTNSMLPSDSESTNNDSSGDASNAFTYSITLQLSKTPYDTRDCVDLVRTEKERRNRRNRKSE